MKKKNRIILQLVVFITMIGLLLVIVKASSVIFKFSEMDTELKKTIEQTARNQARLQLNNMQNIAIEDIKSGILNVNDEYSMQNWAKKNISCMLNGGETGDAFMIELGSEKFIWDGSPDCSRPEFIKNGRYMKDESALHQNPEQAEKVLELMRRGENTRLGDNYWWQFDDAKEWLEWIVIPVDKYGFDGEPFTIGGIKNIEYKKLIIVLGTQSDEAIESYTNSITSIDNFKIDLYLTLGGSVLFGIIFIFYMMHQMMRGE